jgi:putative ABC transport system permease protein
MNFKIFKIAFNNVLKHRRRSILNALTFAVNAVALIMLLGLLKGLYNNMYERSIDLQTGHFKIYNRKYIDEKAKMPLNYSIKNPYDVIEDIKNVPYFVEASPRLIKNAVMSDMTVKTNVIMMGIDMKRELKITTDFTNVQGGRLPESGGRILIGKKLAEMMKLKTGADLLLYSQTVNKANNLVDASLTGIYYIGFDSMEKSVVFVPLKFAQYFLDMGGAATEIIVRIKDRKYVPGVKKRIAEVLAAKYPELEVRDWTQEAAALIAGAQADYTSYAVIFGILLFLAIFIIMNTLTITVFERTAEIGTLRAIGMESGQIGWMFFAEGLILALAGAVLGGIIAMPLAYVLNTHGIQFDSSTMERMNFPMEDAIRGKNVWTDWVLVTVVCAITGAIGAIIPSNRAAKTNIVEALKKGVR